MSRVSSLRAGLLVTLVLGSFILSIAAPDVFGTVMSVALVLLPAVNWLAAVVLRRASWSAPEIVSLANRADDAIVLSIASTLAGLLGLNRLLTLGFRDDVTIGLLALALVLVSLPAIDWLRIWRDVWAPRIRRR